MNLFIKEHYTDKIITSKGTFLGLYKEQSTRNLEVGDYFFIPDIVDNLLIFIQKEWNKIWFLDIIDGKVKGEIEYNILTDKTYIIESTSDFVKIYNNELNKLKQIF